MNKQERAVLAQAVVPDVDSVLDLMRKLAAIRSPYFAWEAIRICIRQKRPFPDWVTDYLGQCADRMCAERMQSERAKRDVRETFQWIFDFPKKKPGPGGLFDQHEGLLKDVMKGGFALLFAMQIHNGEQNLVRARRNAGDEVDEVFGLISGGKTIDDKMLQRILLEQFQLKRLPLTADEWKPLIDLNYLLEITKKMASYFGVS
jgi:hypothetical protein